MCGILAVLNLTGNQVNKDLLVRMRDTMVYRGPDDEGIYIDGQVGLAHRRLSIIDLSDSGHQPMSNKDGTITLVFNGEIYNYIELREELKKKGHQFSSSSDTEVILHQYEEEGESCVEKFNGMFSFVLWDSKKRKLFGARDRLGIKPFYYFVDDKKIIIASEIKAIIEDSQVPREPDNQAVIDYFFAGRPLGNKTLFKNIKELEPGNMISIDPIKKEVRTNQYWNVKYNYNYSRTEKTVSEELFHLLDDSVKVHCRSDASLGCHLSGGLDSSTVVALAAKHRKPLNTFSIKFAETGFLDETNYAKAVARHVGAIYNESIPSHTDLARLLPFLIWHMDGPMATPGGFAYFTVSKLAQEHVKVSLTGHGGDELFGGYPAQFQATYNRLDMFDFPKYYTGKLSKPSFGKKMAQFLLQKNPIEIFRVLKKRTFKQNVTFEEKWIQLHCNSISEGDAVFQKSFLKSLSGYTPKADYLKPLLDVNTDQILDKCLYHDLKVYLPGLLHLEDRVSMSLSIESRVPFLDYRIAEYLATIPPEQKIKDMQPKYLLRQIASSLLPQEVWKRKDKCSFPVPDRFYTSNEVNELTKQILLSPESVNRGIFNLQVLKDACYYNDITWALVNIELWYKIFIDLDPYWISMAKI